MLAITLLTGGGIRKSELFHMFVDVIRKDSVRLYHPVYGSAPGRNKFKDETLAATR